VAKEVSWLTFACRRFWVREGKRYIATRFVSLLEDIVPKLTLIIGLPGSGKTHYAKHGGHDIKYFNDIFHPHYVGTEKDQNAVKAWLQEGKDCIAEDVSLCNSKKREAFLAELQADVQNLKVAVIYFAKDFENCLANILGHYVHEGKHENAFGRIEAFGCLFNRYEIPEGVQVRPVSSPYTIRKKPQM
jgi:hypothetical protein